MTKKNSKLNLHLKPAVNAIRSYYRSIVIMFYIILKPAPKEPKSKCVIFVASNYKINNLIQRPSQILGTNSFIENESYFYFVGEKFNKEINGITVKGFTNNLLGRKKLVDHIFNKNPIGLSFSKHFSTGLFLKLISLRLGAKVVFHLIAPETQNEIFDPKNPITKPLRNLRWKTLLQLCDVITGPRIHIFEPFYKLKSLKKYVSTDLVVGSRFPSAVLSSKQQPNDEYVSELVSKFSCSAIIISRLEPVKQVELAIQAFIDARSRAGTNSCLVVYGAGSQEKSLKNKYENVKYIFFEGHLSHERIYGTLRLFNFHIGLIAGNTILEAAAVKVPTITFGFHIMPELIVDKYSGRLIDPGNKHELVAVIIEWIKNPRIPEMYGVNAYDVACQRYSESNLKQEAMKLEKFISCDHSDFF